MWIIGRSKWVSRGMLFVSFALGALFCYFAKESLEATLLNSRVRHSEQLLEDVIRETVTLEGALLFTVNFLARFLLIQVASLDCMISIAANERKFESMKKRQDELDKLLFCGDLKRLQYYRNKNLDLLVDLVGLDGGCDECPEESRNVQTDDDVASTGDVVIAVTSTGDRSAASAADRSAAPANRERPKQVATKDAPAKDSRNRRGKSDNLRRGISISPRALSLREAAPFIGGGSARRERGKPPKQAPDAESDAVVGAGAGDKRRRKKKKPEEKLLVHVESQRNRRVNQQTE